jgi:hypothetical protein
MPAVEAGKAVQGSDGEGESVGIVLGLAQVGSKLAPAPAGGAMDDGT